MKALCRSSDPVCFPEKGVYPCSCGSNSFQDGCKPVVRQYDMVCGGFMGCGCTRLQDGCKACATIGSQVYSYDAGMGKVVSGSPYFFDCG